MLKTSIKKSSFIPTATLKIIINVEKSAQDRFFTTSLRYLLYINRVVVYWIEY